MKLKAFFVLITLLLSLNKEIYAQSSLNLEYKGEIVLIDSIRSFFQSSLSEFKEEDGTLYIISPDNSTISSYSLSSGHQLQFLDIRGRGPFEMEFLYDLSVSDSNSIYLLDYSGKIVEFNKSDFKPINENQSGIIRASGLHKYNDNFILSHESPTRETYLLRYNYKTKKVFKIGIDQIFENVMLSAFKHGGNFLETNNNKLLLSIPYGNMLYSLNLNDYTLDSLTLNIPEFKATNKELNNELYLQNPEELQNFFTKNSLITGLYKIDNNYLIEVYHMHKDYSRGLAIFNEHFELQCYDNIKDPEIYDGTQDPKIRFSDGNFIFYYREEIHRTKQDSVDKVLTYFKPSCK